MKKIDYIVVPEGVEAVLVMAEPIRGSPKIKKICLASINISPRSKFKIETINHVIETIQYVPAKTFDVKFCLFSNANRVDMSDV